MADDEQFSLCWNNFNSNLSAGFHESLCRGDLVDVTLAAEGQFVKAHRLVLSVCSPYFRKMFTQMPANQHAFVFLKDVSHSALKDLIQFMYCGEVNVKQEALPAFISTAEALQIKGLTDSDPAPAQSPAKPSTPAPQPAPPAQTITQAITPPRVRQRNSTSRSYRIETDDSDDKSTQIVLQATPVQQQQQQTQQQQQQQTQQPTIVQQTTTTTAIVSQKRTAPRSISTPHTKRAKNTIDPLEASEPTQITVQTVTESKAASDAEFIDLPIEMPTKSEPDYSEEAGEVETAEQDATYVEDDSYGDMKYDESYFTEQEEAGAATGGAGGATTSTAVVKQTFVDNSYVEQADQSANEAQVKDEIEDSTEFEKFRIENEKLQESNDEEDVTDESNFSFKELRALAEMKASSSKFMCSIPMFEKVSTETCSSEDTSFSEHASDLKELLDSSLEGRVLLLHHRSKPFENVHRKRLVGIVCTRILERKPQRKISAKVYQKWADEILNLFPHEKKSVYLHEKINKRGNQIIRRLAGKLPDRIHNLKRTYRKSGIISKPGPYVRHGSYGPLYSSPTPTATPTLCRFPKEFDTEKEPDGHGGDDSLLCLKSSSHPWATIEEKWSETVHSRLLQLRHMSMQDYFKEYPALNKPLGYQLLIRDFEFVYPSSSQGLKENLPLLKKHIYDIAYKKSSANLKDFLKMFDDSEETSNLATFLLIPSLLSLSTWRLVTKKKVKMWRPTKADARNGFITHVSSEADIKKMISQRKKKLMDLGLTLQPFIIIVGPALEKITTYYVVVNETMYVLPNILEAVDTCFKTIFMLNTQYPNECHSTWMFIQSAFYKIITRSDRISTATNTLLGELGFTD